MEDHSYIIVQTTTPGGLHYFLLSPLCPVFEVSIETIRPTTLSLPFSMQKRSDFLIIVYDRISVLTDWPWHCYNSPPDMDDFPRQLLSIFMIRGSHHTVKQVYLFMIRGSHHTVKQVYLFMIRGSHHTVKGLTHWCCTLPYNDFAFPISGDSNDMSSLNSIVLSSCSYGFITCCAIITCTVYYMIISS